ncbi:hypothetical protein KY336_02085 [Candidatus Woesearchaeota archaeon]|nr:hypothetical protein [Candidatus Woesearchaeota archaeon]
MDDNTQQEPLNQGPKRYSADDGLRLLYSLGYGRRFNMPAQREEFRKLFPGVYEESGYDFLYALCMTVGRKIPLVRFEKNPDYRFNSGQYRKFGADFDERFNEKYGELIKDKISLEKILEKLRIEIDPDAPVPEEENDDEDPDIDPDEVY